MKYVFEDVQLDKSINLAAYETYFQTYILEDNVTSTGAAGDTRGANIVDLTYHEFCRNCHTTF